MQISLSRKFLQILKIFSKFPKLSYTSLIIAVSIMISVSLFADFNKESIRAENNALNAKKEKINSADNEVSEIKINNKKTISGEVKSLQITASPSPIPSPISDELNISTEIQTYNSGLLEAVNVFRNSNGLPSLNSADGLCLISQKRLDELIAIGSLDNHAGFSKYFQGQTEFAAMGEVIFQSSNQTSPEYAVNEGWAKSTSGHRENMLDPKWNYGCGVTNEYFAVFNFGKK